MESPEMTITAEPIDPEARAEALHRRGLFAYHDGFRNRLADQIEVQMRMQEAVPRGDMNLVDDLLDVIAEEGKPAPPPADPTEEDESASETSPPTKTPKMSVFVAMVRLAQIVTAGFQLPPLEESSGRGLSVREKVDLLADFLSMAPGTDEDGGDEDGGDEDSEADDEAH